MAEMAASGGSGSLRVTPSELKRAGDLASQISTDVGSLVSTVSPASAPAAAAHAGWQFGQALSLAIPAWEGHLAAQAWTVSAAGARLAASAAHYSATEEHMTAAIRAISAQLIGAGPG